MANKKKTYTPIPQVPEPLRPRYEAVLGVLSGHKTVSAAASELGLSRNHFQTLMHRGLDGLMTGLSPKSAGRPAMPAREAELQRQNEALQQDNERLRRKTETIDRLLGVASGLLQGRVKASGRTTNPRTKKTAPKPTTEEPEGAMEGAMQMRALGLTKPLIAAVLGVSVATLRRWTERGRTGLAIVRKPGPGQRRASLDPHTEARVEDVVRTTRGLAGARAVQKSVGDVSRREVAKIKRETLTTMEKERVAATERIRITQPGVVRGFDQLWVSTSRGHKPVLVSADACVPYRTSLMVAERYDSAAVAAAIDDDFRRHGPPLVWRADRASCHRTDEVDELLRAWGVLRLHGPAHLPRFYGQLERQNREHRGWLTMSDTMHPSELEGACERMREALNAAWRRPTLDWKTAAEAWEQRPRLCDDRLALRDEVADRATRITEEMKGRASGDTLLPHRLAVEHALTIRGYLRRQPGGWC